MSRPTRLLWVDGSAGAAGDMIVGALVDAGVPLAILRRAIAGIALDGISLHARRVTRCGLAARKIDVRVRLPQPARGRRAIRAILRASALDAAVRRRALDVFERLLDAEAAAHGSAIERTHLHEAGGADAIADVVGACAAREWLGIDRVRVSRLTTGHGEVRCAHGVYPVPAPATLRLLRDVPVEGGDLAVERLTPTGAAILVSWADEWGPLPALRPWRVGHGAGARDFADRPNCLRVVVGDADSPAMSSAGGRIAVIEATVDDATPQQLAWTAERLLAAGALDVFTTAVTMKKGRLGHTLTALAALDDAAALALVFLAESSTLGVRTRVEERVELERATRRIRTRWGTVRVKLGLAGGRPVQVWPEYEDCATLARRAGVPLKEIQQAALAAWRAADAGRKPRKGTT